MVVIGVSTDDSESAAKAYLRSSNATLNHYIDEGLAVENMLGANRLPLTVLINDKGKIVGKFYGARQWDQPEASHWIETGLRQK
jgi:peroxiredoxin